MEQFTVYVDETIPMVITDDDVTKMANETIDYMRKWTRQYNSNDIRGIVQHVFVGFFENFCYDKLGCVTEEELEEHYLEYQDESLIIFEILDKIPVKIQQTKAM